MKAKVMLGAMSLALSFACSAGSGDDGGGNGSHNQGSGNNTSTGATSSVGAGPSSGGSLNIDPGVGSAGEPVVANGECDQQNFVLSSKPADVLLVLDRSKSMIEHTVPPSNQTRWDAVVAGLTAVITATDSSVSWGLKFFPEGEGSECSASSVTNAVPAPIMPGNAATVNGLITSTMALGNGTPTGDAIKQATAYLQSRNMGNQFIVLATDGQPSCPSGSDAAVQYAVDAITAAKTAGFPTYVIGVVDPVADKSTPPRLNAMAEAGGTARTDNPIGDKFFQAYSQDELTNSLKAVTGQVVSCVFEFKAKPPDETNIAVKINGQRIDQDTTKAQGWDYVDDQYMALELHGDACQEVKDATENKVDIIFGCKGVPIK